MGGCVEVPPAPVAKAPSRTLVVGRLSRLILEKDPVSFVLAAPLVAAALTADGTYDSVKFVLGGAADDATMAQLRDLAADVGADVDFGVEPGSRGLILAPSLRPIISTHDLDVWSTSFFRRTTFANVFWFPRAGRVRRRDRARRSVDVSRAPRRLPLLDGLRLARLRRVRGDGRGVARRRDARLRRRGRRRRRGNRVRRFRPDRRTATLVERARSVRLTLFHKISGGLWDSISLTKDPFTLWTV